MHGECLVLGGAGKFVLTLQTWATLPACPQMLLPQVLFKKKGWKRKCMTVSPRAVLQSFSSAVFSPEQHWLPRRPGCEGHRAVYELWALHCPDSLLLQPSSVPTDSSFKISNSRDSTTCPVKVFQSFAVPAVKSNWPFGYISSMSPAVIEFFSLSYLQQWEKAFISFFAPISNWF